MPPSTTTKIPAANPTRIHAFLRSVRLACSPAAALMMPGGAGWSQSAARATSAPPKHVGVDVLQILGVEPLLSIGELKIQPRGCDDNGNVTGIRHGHGRSSNLTLSDSRKRPDRNPRTAGGEATTWIPVGTCGLIGPASYAVQEFTLLGRELIVGNQSPIPERAQALNLIEWIRHLDDLAGGGRRGFATGSRSRLVSFDGEPHVRCHSVVMHKIFRGRQRRHPDVEPLHLHLFKKPLTRDLCKRKPRGEARTLALGNH